MTVIVPGAVLGGRELNISTAEGAQPAGYGSRTSCAALSLELWTSAFLKTLGLVLVFVFFSIKKSLSWDASGCKFKTSVGTVRPREMVYKPGDNRCVPHPPLKGLPRRRPGLPDAGCVLRSGRGEHFFKVRFSEGAWGAQSVKRPALDSVLGTAVSLGGTSGRSRLHWET